MKTRRVIALLVAILTLVTATASAEWFYAGLDTSAVNTSGEIYRVYNEKINDAYTGKVKQVEFTLKEYATLVDWEFEGFEFQYPHAGYDRLYVEGEAQGNTRYNNIFPQWETKFADYIWEIANEVEYDVNGNPYYVGHRIYQRQMTKIPGYGWAWDFGKTAEDEAKVYVETTRYADVAETYKITGFANLKLNGEKLFEITEDKQLLDPAIRGQYNAINLYKDFGRFHTIEEFAAEFDYDWENFTFADGSFLSDANLSERDANGEYVVSNLEIKERLAKYSVATKWLDGPSYHGEDGVKDVASLYIEDLKIVDGRDISVNPMWKWEQGKIDWKWDTDTVANGIPVYKRTSNCLVCGILNDCDICNFDWELVDYNNIEIDWTPADYEFDEEYNYYQCLIVNGIVFDGTKDTPRVIRHTGGKASPKVEWKYVSYKDLKDTFTILGALDVFEENLDILGATQVVEWKYVNDVPAFYDNGLPILRIPTGEFAKCFIKITDSHVELWRETVYGEELAAQCPIQEAPAGDYAGFAPGAVWTEMPAGDVSIG